MKYVIKKPSKKPIKITPLSKNEFEKQFKKLPNFTQNQISSRRTEPNVHDFIYVPDEKGNVKEILFIREEVTDIWTYSDLPRRLAAGEYELNAKYTEANATLVAAGWELGTYNYVEFKRSENNYAKLVCPQNANYDEAEALSNSIAMVRDLINRPAANLTPLALAEIARKVANENGAKIKIIKGKELLGEGYESLYTVGKASENEPCLIDIRWGKKTDPKVTLVGKGITFDTGGLNIKGEANMRLMKKDMGGSAIVLGLGKIIMSLGLPINLRVMIGAAENSIGSNSMRPSDVIRTRAGITVEIDNTDAEGRLVLCEPLHEADQEKPDLLIDIATLTGAARVAVGTEMAAFFTPSDKLAEEFYKTSLKVNDPAWRLPLWESYKKMLESKVADFVNSPETGNGGAITAALFLKEFVKNTKEWMHLDLMAWNVRPRPGRPVGGEAMSLRALYQMIKDRYC